MISRLHDKLGTAGLVVAVIALIAAVAGTALAAGGLTKQQEKQVKKIAKQFAGKQGPPGAPGSNGTNGKDGSAGAPGSAGKGVKVTGTASGCAEGGITVEVEGSGNANEVCNGAEGEPGTNGEPWTPNSTLPGGAVETGTWGFAGKPTAALSPIVPISFPIKLASALGPTKVHLINNNGEEIVINESNGAREEQAPTGCGSPVGTVGSPTADPGNLCVYSQVNLGNLGANTFVGSNLIHTPASGCENLACLAAFGGPGGGTSVSGALVGIGMEAEEGVKVWGSWAVTG